MSVKIMAAVWEIAGLSPAEKLVLLKHADHADDAGERSFPSIARLAETCGLSERQVQYVRKKLVDAGWLIPTDYPGGGRNHATVYAVKTVQSAAPFSDTKGEAGCTVSNTKRVQSSAKRVQSSAGKGATHCTPTILTIQENHPGSELFPPESIAVVDDVDLAISSWNAMATEAGLPTVRKLTKPLHGSLKARLSECGGIEGWRAVLERVRQSEFLCGAGDRGWRANLKWLVRPGNAENVISGNYDNRSKPRFTKPLHDELKENANGRHRQDRTGRHRAGNALTAAAKLASETD